MTALKSVDIIGAGPAGLYCAILLRQKLPDTRVRVFEQNPADATFGFGVVFSDRALDFLADDDPDMHTLTTPHMQHWQTMSLSHPTRNVVLDGIGFASIGRLEFLRILHQRASELGAELIFGKRIDTTEQAELVVGADGVNSVVRSRATQAFGETLDYFNNRFIWFGATRAFDTLTQTFQETEFGAMNAHHYRYSEGKSTFIVECTEQTYNSAGFDAMDDDTCRQTLENCFAETLCGASLLTNNSRWRRFPKLWCKNWVNGRQVLIGDAAHTAHFSIGSGTRLAMEDAIALVRSLSDYADVDTALDHFQTTRKPIAKKIIDAANDSALWYEQFDEHMSKPALEFAYSYLTRSGRLNPQRLRDMSPQFMAEYDASVRSLISDQVSAQSPGALELGFDIKQHKNCSEILWSNLTGNADKAAVIGPLGSKTYQELISDAARWGNAFIRYGLHAGDRIIFFLDDTPAYPAAFFGAVRAGFVPVLVNTSTNKDTLNYFLLDSSARLALCESNQTDLFTDAILEDTAVETVVTVNGTEHRKRFVSDGVFLAEQLTTLACADTAPDDMAFWMYSSGSTGRPKAIVHLQHDMAYTHASYGQHILRLKADDVCFSIPKIYFAYGLGNSFTFPFSVGATSVLLPGRPQADVILHAIETFRPTVLFGLPTLYTALCRADGVENRDLSSIRQSISAAETLSEDVYNTWERLTGHGPTEGLGSTELLHIYLSNRPEDHRIGAVGARVPGYEIRLENQQGEAVNSGEEGIMSVRGHSSAPCYWNKPDKTRETMQQGWVYTGDRFIEREGYYYFQGRADDLIKVSGQWVWPLEVERCLNDHPDVHECAVLPHTLPDKRVTLLAMVTLRDPEAVDVTQQTLVLQNYVKETLQPYKYPRIIEYLNDIPKTGTGKIDRQLLHTMLQQTS